MHQYFNFKRNNFHIYYWIDLITIPKESAELEISNTWRQYFNSSHQCQE